MNSCIKTLLSILTILACTCPTIALTMDSPENEVEQERQNLESLNGQALDFVERDAYPFYTGYIEYLRFQMMYCFKYREAEYSTFKEKLETWLEKAPKGELPENPHFYEWAYLSKVDGSGQPITIQVPDSYADDTPSKLRVTMHGAGMTHALSPEFKVNQNYVRVNVLGRSRTGGYANLSETDVLEAIDFMKRHWNIDPDSVYVSGGSMGGGGTFKLTTRYPHLFSSAFIECGYGVDVNIKNALHIPFVSRHSVDDSNVTISSSRVPLHELKALGGSVLIYETTGFGHGIWNDTNQKDEQLEQFYSYQRPKEFTSFSYTATDGLALRSYWAEIVKWGKKVTPASFDVKLDSGTLVINTENIGIMKVLLDESPLADERELELAINGESVTYRRKGKNGDLYLNLEGRKPVISEKIRNPKTRYHFPGGVNALYKGEPILIVYGTTGGDTATDVLRTAAEAASRSSSPAWLPDEHETQADITELSQFKKERSIPRRAMFTANLPVKADTEVTKADMKKYNLLLLGTPDTNSLVKRFSRAKNFPVIFSEGQAIVSDGMKYPLENKALGLLWYNPKHRERLVYFAMSDDLSFYKPRNPLMSMQTRAGRSGIQASPDLTICSAEDPQIVCQRNFDADWKLDFVAPETEFLSERLCRKDEYNRFVTGEVAAEAGADFYITFSGEDPEALLFTPGSTRWSDIVEVPNQEYPLLYTYSGEEIGEIIKKIEEHNSKEDTGEKIVLYNRAGSSEIAFEPGKEYVLLVSSFFYSGYERAVMMEQPVARKYKKSFQEILAEQVAEPTR